MNCVLDFFPVCLPPFFCEVTLNELWYFVLLLTFWYCVFSQFSRLSIRLSIDSVNYNHYISWLCIHNGNNATVYSCILNTISENDIIIELIDSFFGVTTDGLTTVLPLCSSISMVCQMICSSCYCWSKAICSDLLRHCLCSNPKLSHHL